MVRYACSSGNRVSSSEDWRGVVIGLVTTYIAQFEPDSQRADICDERPFGDPERYSKIIKSALLTSVLPEISTTQVLPTTKQLQPIQWGNWRTTPPALLINSIAD